MRTHGHYNRGLAFPHLPIGPVVTLSSLLILLAINEARAAEYNWYNTVGDGRWCTCVVDGFTTITNWYQHSNPSTNCPPFPGPADSVVLDASHTPLPYTVTLYGCAATIGSLVQDPAATLDIRAKPTANAELLFNNGFVHTQTILLNTDGNFRSILTALGPGLTNEGLLVAGTHGSFEPQLRGVVENAPSGIINVATLLKVTGPTFNQSGGQINGPGQLVVPVGCVFNHLFGELDATVALDGGSLFVDEFAGHALITVMTVNEGILLDNRSTDTEILVQVTSGTRNLHVADGATNSGTIRLQSTSNNSPRLAVVSGGTFTNQMDGLILTGPHGIFVPRVYGTMHNLGTLRVPATTQVLEVMNTPLNIVAGTLSAGTYEATGILRLNSPVLSQLDATAVLDGSASRIADLSNAEILTSISTITPGGTLKLANGRDMTINAASLSNGGKIDLGKGCVLSTSGAVSMTTTGFLDFQLGGTVEGVDFGRLNATGVASIDGQLNVTLAPGYSPLGGESYRIVQAGSVTGTFAATSFPSAPPGFSWTVEYQSNRVLLWVFDIDDDDDLVLNSVDNCPSVYNPLQSDVDASGQGDLCDVCPADSTNQCLVSSSTAKEITATTGGSASTPNGAVQVAFSPNSLSNDASFSVTAFAPSALNHPIKTGTAVFAGSALATYDLHPEQITFSPPAAMTIKQDVSSINPAMRDLVCLAQFDGAHWNCDVSSCDVFEEQAGVFITTCTADVLHFSEWAIVVPEQFLNNIPTISEWGVLLMTLLVLIAGTLLLSCSDSRPTNDAENLRSCAL